MSDHNGRRLFELRRTLEEIWTDVAGAMARTADRGLVSAELALHGPAGPLRLAVDGSGHRHLLLPLSDEDPPVGKWRSAGVELGSIVKVLDGETVSFVDLECRREDLDGVFTGLVADVCVLVAREPDFSSGELLKLLDSWRELLGGARQNWTVSRLAGLYGELVVLEELLALDRTAAQWWVGHRGAPQDFRRGTAALEVKTTTAAVGRTVRIHGVDQLERSVGGTLSLIWCRLTVLPAGRGDGIPQIVGRCSELAGASEVLPHLDRLGLPGLASEELRGVGFEVSERKNYDVSGNFPRITPDAFEAGAVPGGILNIEYTVDLDTVTASEEDLSMIAKRFAGLG